MKISKFDLLIRIYVLAFISTFSGIGIFLALSIFYPKLFILFLIISHLLSSLTAMLIILLLYHYLKNMKGGNYTNANTKKHNRRLEK